MKSIITGQALFHEGTFYEEADKDTKANPKPYFSLMVMEADKMRGAVLRKVKVPKHHVGPASGLSGHSVELIVEQTETNYRGKAETVFTFESGKKAA